MQELYALAVDIASALGINPDTPSDPTTDQSAGEKSDAVLTGDGTWTGPDGRTHPVSLKIDVRNGTFTGKTSAHTESNNKYGDLVVSVTVDTKGALTGKFSGTATAGTLDGTVDESMTIITNDRKQSLSDRSPVTGALQNGVVTGTLGRHPFKVTLR